MEVEVAKKNRLVEWAKKETVLLIACLLAAGSCFLVPPDAGYAGYIDSRTLILLFCLMAVVAGLQELGLFHFVGGRLLTRVRTKQQLIGLLTALCFFSSMLVTNDIALITFIPFGVLVLQMAEMHWLLCISVTLMTIAANLGSMLTPIGNPQNLYLYNASKMTLGAFLHLMLPYTAISFVMLAIVVCLMCGKREVIPEVEMGEMRLDYRRLGFYLVLFLICLLAVAKIIPEKLLLVVILAAVALENKQLFAKIDYSLLLTFMAFFIFIGNIGRFPMFYQMITTVLAGRERFVAIGASQIISNVPAALLLSSFTHQWNELIIGTNLGGLGTLIASMASLISYKQIAVQFPTLKTRYLLVFTVWNLLFLFVFLILSFLS